MVLPGLVLGFRTAAAAFLHIAAVVHIAAVAHIAAIAHIVAVAADDHIGLSVPGVAQVVAVLISLPYR